MTATEKQYWAGEFTDAELDAAADAGCTGMSDAYNIPNPRRKSVPMATPEEMQAALERAKESAVLEERNRLAGEIHDGLAQSFTASACNWELPRRNYLQKKAIPSVTFSGPLSWLTLVWLKHVVTPTICA